MCRLVIDNDVVAKGAIYDLLQPILACLSALPSEVGLLGTLKYALPRKRLRTARDGAELAHGRLISFIAACVTLEPDRHETLLATKLEETANKLDVQLDIGESQLCAIAIRRGVDLMCTGDKRAIAAIESLRTQLAELVALDNKVLCLEVLLQGVIATYGYEHTRPHICGSKGTDRALEICFQCHNQTGDAEETLNGLLSYIAHVAQLAPNTSATSLWPIPQ